MRVINRFLKYYKQAAGATHRWLYSSQLRSASKLTLPDFLGIGAQKSGTSWLAKNLRYHPQIFVSKEKELHYFDRNYHRSLSHYGKHFLSGRNQVKGEITPAYAILEPKVIRFIHTLMPNLRLIYLIRNPIDRAWSQAYMNLVSLPGRPYGDVKENEFIAHFHSPRSTLRGDYRRCVDNWLDCFPQEQLLIEFFEDIACQPKQLLERVFHHLNVEPPQDWSAFPFNEKVFAGNPRPMPEKFRAILEDMYAEEIGALELRFGKKVSNWRVSNKT